MKNRVIALVMSCIISIQFFCCVSVNKASAASSVFEEASVNEVSEHEVGDITQSVTQDAAVWLNEEMSAFEITAIQRKDAKTNAAGYTVLDAGRGNPNWINTQARYAFSRFMVFAIGQSELEFKDGAMAGHATLDGIGERFDQEMNPEDETDAFLISAVDYCEKKLGLDRDELIKEFVDGIIGDYYPTPSRCLKNTEVILNEYLQSTLYNGADIKDLTVVFPTEGGSAAMCYIFQALSHNKILNPKDKIAIATPIFTPYLEIPDVCNYGLVSIDVSSTEEDNWDISEEELKKLEDPEIKAFFLVNPSNPASHALSQKTLDALQKVVEKNPDLIILTDDVYGTFVDNFQTIYSVLPYNTILVYSFSKLYGATGWRTGLIAMSKDNVCDKLLSELSDENKAFLAKEYSSITPDVEDFPFIERVTADSRSIGLYHTSGLSTPSQIFMDLLSLSHLVCEGKDEYIEKSKEVVNSRYTTLMNALELPCDESDMNAQYYTLINVDELCKKMYGEDFADWKQNTYTDLDFLNMLASEKGVVLMYGPGFDTKEGYVRVSLANLFEEDYVQIAERLKELIGDLYEIYQADELEAAA